jgi:DNA-binding response OmpR family regulator
MYKVLICDDETDIRNALNIYLSAQGYETVLSANGQEALDAVAQGDIDLVLLDIMMPVMDGITVLAKLRKTSNVPVILLTAKSEDTDKILGLDVGADDYITKPFNPMEVLARVKSQLRRYTQLGSAVVPETSLSCGPVTMDDRAKTVTVDGDPVSLTPTEYEILKLFLSHPGKVFSIAEIYRLVWKEAPFGSEGTVAVHIRHLREKIEIDPANPRCLKVVWGQGYKFVSD